MMALASVYQELGLPTLSELILGLPGDSYERHVKSLSEVVEAGIDIIDTYTCMLLNGTELNSALSRATYKIGSHFRILPRDFAKAPGTGASQSRSKRLLLPRAQCHSRTT